MESKIGYSLLTVKSLDEDRREIYGIASTPEVDAAGDIVELDGINFNLPLPFLKGHNHNEPIGEVFWAKKTSKGLEIKARIAKVDSPSQLSARLSEAWELIKNGLMKGLSIGFMPVEYAVIQETGGLRFLKSRIHEISAVVVPCNYSGQITSVKELKSLDKAARDAALGTKSATSSVRKSTGVSGTVKLTSKEKTMNLSEKLKGFRDELALKNSKLVELAEKSADTGETFDQADQEAFDTLNAEVKSLEGHITRLEIAEKAAVKTARPVTEQAGHDEVGAGAARNRVFAQVKSTPKLDKGIGFARVARCKALSKMDNAPAYEIARGLYGEDSDVYGVLKAAVAAGTTTGTNWAAPLVGSTSDVFADFVEYLRPMTILGRMGQNGIPGPTRIPFRTRLITQTSGGEGYWVGEGAPKPLTDFDFTGTSLSPLKVANIAVVTMELLRDSSPSAEALVRDGLAGALAERLDIDFVNPAKTASAGVSPASITNGVTPIVSAGATADDVRCDIAALLEAYAAANNPPTTGVIIMSASLAIKLMAMRNALGQREFPEITMGGGFLEGFPVITSQYLSAFAVTAGEYVFMVNASDIWFADEGGISVDMSDQASLQFLDNPTNNGTGSTTATSMISLWQGNLVGFRAERSLNWAKRRSTAVQVLSNVAWNACP